MKKKLMENILNVLCAKDYAVRASLLPGVKYGMCTSVFVIQLPLEIISGEDK